MTEKEKLLQNLIEKSDRSKEELEKLVKEKVNELSGLVSEEGAIYIIANELGVRLDSEKPKKVSDSFKIDQITEPKTPVSLTCKVLRKYDKVEFSSKSGGEGSVQSVLVGDETGIIRTVFWNDKTELLENIQEGDILNIVNAYTRENLNNERIEIHYGQYSDIEVNPKGVEVNVKEIKSDIDFKDKKVADLEEGEKNVKLSGMVTDFEIPRFYLGCPECYKKVFQDDDSYKCAEHGEVKPLRIPIVNIVIDDGSGVLSIVGFRDRAEQLTKKKTEEILSFTEDIDEYRSFSKQIVGSKIEVGGNVSSNNMTGELQLIVNQLFNVEFKSTEEVVEELLEESESEDDKKKRSVMDDDDLDLEIEEIDLDDDLL